MLTGVPLPQGTMAAKRKIAREIFDMEGEPQLQVTAPSLAWPPFLSLHRACCSMRQQVK